MAKSLLVSVVVPVFNEEDGIAPFLAAVAPELDAAAKRWPRLACEFVFVNDGSRDATLARILDIQQADPRVRAVDLSRNFGKEAAMTAGIAEARGDAVVVIDVDLQDPPELLGQMIDRWREGAKVVLARRVDRSDDSRAKRVTANWFYRFHNAIAGVKIPANVGDCRLMDRIVVDELVALPENRRFMKGLFAWIGFEPVYIDYKRSVRTVGQTKFSGWRLWRFAVEGITSFSAVPLVVWTYVGIAVSLLAFVYGSFIIVKTLVSGVDVPGYASTLAAVLFLGGIQLFGIGVLGEYIGRIYDESKRRPPYVVAGRYEAEKKPARQAASKSRTRRPEVGRV